MDYLAQSSSSRPVPHSIKTYHLLKPYTTKRLPLLHPVSNGSENVLLSKMEFVCWIKMIYSSKLLPVKQAMMWMLRTLVKKGITTARNVLPTDWRKIHKFLKYSAAKHMETAVRWCPIPSDSASGCISIGNTFDIELENSASAPGDYLYRSGSFKWDVKSGMWGIFRVAKQGIRCKCKNLCQKAFACICKTNS